MSMFLGKNRNTPPAKANNVKNLIVVVTGGYGLLLLVLCYGMIGNLPLIAQNSASVQPSGNPYDKPASVALADIGYSSLLAGAPVISVPTNTATPTVAPSTTPTVSTASTINTHCSFDTTTAAGNALKGAFNTSAIFPILPSAVLTGETTVVSGDTSNNVATNCTPLYWNLDIARVLLYKALGLLNYVIEIAAIILTIYAGILYLSGFANEKNISTAKTMLIATYTGLIISLSATLIIKTTIGIFANSTDSKTIQNNDTAIFHGNAN